MKTIESIVGVILMWLLIVIMYSCAAQPDHAPAPAARPEYYNGR